MPTILRASLALVPILSLLAACTSDNPVADAGPGGQVCPVTIVQATAAAGEDGVTSKCHATNYICVVGFQCGSFTQQATCTCDGSAFSCVLADGTAVAADVTDPSSLCKPVNNPPPPDTCPTDKTTAQGTACKNAGQQCYYASSCTTSPPPTDVCQCKGNELGDAGLSWACDINCN